MKYFLHDTNAMQDEAVTKVFMKYGYEGVGLYYAILERIAFQEQPVETAVLKKQLFVNKKLEKVWAFLEEVKLIYTENGKTFNEEILNVAEKYLVKREKSRKRLKEWRAGKGDAENETHFNDVSKRVRNAPKEKEIKENKNNDDVVEITTSSAGDNTSNVFLDSHMLQDIAHLKTKVLHDNVFAAEFLKMGLDADKLEGWLEVFNKWLVYKGGPGKQERDYRAHFKCWIVKQPYTTADPATYDPVQRAKGAARAEPVPAKLPTAEEILERRNARRLIG